MSVCERVLSSVCKLKIVCQSHSGEPAVSSLDISDAGCGWFPDSGLAERTWNLPRRNRFRVLAAAGSLFADDAVAAADATAVASDDAAAAAAAVAVVVVAVAPAAGIDTDTGTDIGTAATGTGIDIGDWVGVFGAALPGPAVPYRWDDMYHQKPGLAVCLYVVFNHFVSSFALVIQFVAAGTEHKSLPLVFLLCVWTHRTSLWLSMRAVILIRGIFLTSRLAPRSIAVRRRSGAQKIGNKCLARRREH